MRTRHLIAFLGLFILLGSWTSNSEKAFSVSIEYKGYWGSPIKYLLTNKAISLIDFKYRQGKRVYYRALSSKEGENAYLFLKDLSYDTLKSEYSNNNVDDGLNIRFNISGEGLSEKSCSVYMTSTRVTDSLENFIQEAVHNKKYRWKNYCNEK